MQEILRDMDPLASGYAYSLLRWLSHTSKRVPLVNVKGIFCDCLAVFLILCMKQAP